VVELINDHTSNRCPADRPAGSPSPRSDCTEANTWPPLALDRLAIHSQPLPKEPSLSTVAEGGCPWRRAGKAALDRISEKQPRKGCKQVARGDARGAWLWKQAPPVGSPSQRCSGVAPPASASRGNAGKTPPRWPGQQARLLGSRPMVPPGLSGVGAAAALAHSVRSAW